MECIKSERKFATIAKKKTSITKLISMLLVCTLMFSTLCTTASAETSGTCGVSLTWTLDETGLLTISGTGAMSNYSSASKVPWYEYRESIKEVVIENGVTRIGNYAFAGCLAINEVTINDSVTAIGNSAFKECTALTRIDIPDNVTSVEGSAFYGCTVLEEVYLGYRIKTIGGYAFDSCKALKSIAIPDSVETIGNYAFEYCDLLESVTIGSGVTSIGDYAFKADFALKDINVYEDNEYYCSVDGSLFTKDEKTLVQYAIGKQESAYNIPYGVTTIGKGVFYDCVTLTEITIPDTVTTINAMAFYDCENVTEFIIPDSVTSIGSSSFRGGDSLQSVVIGNGIETISSSAFRDLASLTKLTIGSGVTSIADKAFSGSVNLTNVYYNGTERKWNTISIGANNEPLSTARFSFEEDALQGIKITSVPKKLEYVKGESLDLTGLVVEAEYLEATEIIDNYTVSGFDSETIGEKIVTITYEEFTSYFNVTVSKDAFTVSFVDYDGTVLAEKMVSWGKSATAPKPPERENYKFLCWDKDFTIVKEDMTVTAIYEKIVEASGVCGDNVTWVLYTSGVLKLEGSGEMYDYNAFESPWYEYKDTIITLEIADEVTTIGSYVFLNCINLQRVALHKNIKYIGAHAFDGCIKLAELELPKNVVVADGAFSGCHAMTQIPIPGATTDILPSEFAGFAQATAIVIPEGVVTIGENAFLNCGEVKSVYIPNSVKNIGLNAFADCKSIEKVIYYGTKNDWEKINIAAGNEILTEKLYCQRFTVIFIDYDKTVLSTQIVDLGGSAEEPGTPTREGYNFIEWSGKYWNIDADKTIQAIYRDNRMVSYVETDYLETAFGSGDYKESYSHTYYDYPGEKVTASPSHYDNYTYNAEKSAETISGVVTADEVLELKIYYSKNEFDVEKVTYEVTFKTEFGDIIEVIEKEEYSYISSPPTPPTIQGYKFVGWNSDAYKHSIESDIEIIALYAYVGGEVGYEVKFVGFDNEVISTETVVEGSTVDFPEAPEIDGYDFCGWYTGKNGTGTQFVAGDIVKENLTLYVYYYEKEEPQINNVEIVKLPEKLIYTKGKSLDLTGLEVYAVYEDGSKTKVEDYNVSGYDSLVIGVQTIIVEYEGKTATFDVTVMEEPDPEPDPTPEIIASGTCGENLTWTLDETGLLTISGKGDMENYADGYFATWYEYIGDIKKVVIEEGVTTVGDWAFFDCYNITCVGIPNSITTIGAYTFQACTGLTSIELPDSITTIGMSAFSGCGSLKSIEMSDSITTIGDYAFSSCDSLTSIELPDSVTTIGYCAFLWCDSLKSINVDKNNENYCSVDGNLLNKDKTELIQYALGKTDSLYIIPNSVTTIGDWAFSACQNLTSVEMGDDVITIGNFVFASCSKLTSVKIGSNVDTIGNNAFWVCTSLTDVYYNGTEEEWNNISIGYDNDPLLNATIHFKEPVVEDDALIKVSKARGLEGDTFEIDVEISGNPGIASMMLKVDYDTNNLKLVEVKDHGKLGNTLHSDNLQGKPYILSWENDTASANITENGVVATLVFEAVEGAPIGFYPVTVSYDKDNYDIFDIDLEPVEFAIENGEIEIADFLYGDVNGDKAVNTLDRLFLTRHISKWIGFDTIDTRAADVNKDGYVNALDRAILSRHLSNWSGYEALPCKVK